MASSKKSKSERKEKKLNRDEKKEEEAKKKGSTVELANPRKQTVDKKSKSVSARNPSKPKPNAINGKNINGHKKGSGQNGVVREPEVIEIVGSSSSDSGEEEEETGGEEELLQRSNAKSKSATPKKRSRKEAEEEGSDGGEEGSGEREGEVKMCRFPMNRIRRIIKSEDPDSQIMQEAVFLVNKATEMFIEQFSEDAYECSVRDRKKVIHYKHLSSVVSDEKRFEFLADFVPEKIIAEDALERRKLAETCAG